MFGNQSHRPSLDLGVVMLGMIASFLTRNDAAQNPGFLCVCQAAVWAVVESEVAGSGSDLSEELAVGVEPAALGCRVAP